MRAQQFYPPHQLIYLSYLLYHIQTEQKENNKRIKHTRKGRKGKKKPITNHFFSPKIWLGTSTCLLSDPEAAILRNGLLLKRVCGRRNRHLSGEFELLVEKWSEEGKRWWERIWEEAIFSKHCTGVVFPFLTIENL